ncbi:MAG TPA: type II toxin-antitoxin system HicB family antitoxin [Pirellulales bacterium]|nr:type II toxin-antitoxin system HicB family antitoxin [Pirellulales bacterium]
MSIIAITGDVERRDRSSVVEWELFAHEMVFQCHVILLPEDVGYSAHCLNLPGVISEGDTEEEAIENIKDAFRETMLYYRSSGETIPKERIEVERLPGYLERRVVVRI